MNIFWIYLYFNLWGMGVGLDQSGDEFQPGIFLRIQVLMSLIPQDSSIVVDGPHLGPSTVKIQGRPYSSMVLAK